MNAMLKPMEDEQNELISSSALSDMQAKFVEEYIANGGRQTKAAESAGYLDPATAAYRLVRLPHVQAAIRAETERAVMGGGVRSVRWMVQALDDQKMAGAVRFQCAKWLAEAAGHGLAAQRIALGVPVADKPLSEMTLDELDTFIAAGKAATERLKQDRMRTIDGEVRSDARNSDTPEA